MSHFSPPPQASLSSAPKTAYSTVSSRDFRMEGEFQGFASGKKSPFKYLWVKTETEDVRIKLKKSLRMMLFRYLAPGDWVRVMGRQKWDGDEMVLKAEEVVRIAKPESGHLKKTSDRPSQTSKKKPKAKASKILICQKSSCRKRGGTAVGKMVERSLCELGLSEHVSVKYTGCMDRCKAGPNVVFMPGKAKYTRVKPHTVPDLVRQHCRDSEGTPQ